MNHLADVNKAAVFESQPNVSNEPTRETIRNWLNVKSRERNEAENRKIDAQKHIVEYNTTLAHVVKICVF